MDKNYEKYETYKKMHEDLNRAMKYEFYYEAIFIEYAIIEDRLSSLLKHAKINKYFKKGDKLSITEKLNTIRDSPTFNIPFVRERITVGMIEHIRLWKDERNKLIHNLANISYTGKEVKLIALEGNELVKVFANKVNQVDRYFDRKYKKQENNKS